MNETLSIDSNHTSATAPTTPSYRFERFKTRHMLADIAFSRGAKRAGEPISNATLYTLDGERTTLREYAAGRPVLIVTGSITCPMTASSLPDLNELYREYGDRVAFAQLYVREAHPGASFPQPHSIADKIGHARDLKARFDVQFPLLVDDIDGTLHRELDAIANSAHLVANDGTLVFRSLWAGDRMSVEQALADVTEKRASTRVSSSRRMGPLTRALGYISDVLTGAGRGAKRDLAVGAPPMAILSGVASLFSFVPKSRRGAFAIASAVAAVAAVAATAIII